MNKLGNLSGTKVKAQGGITVHPEEQLRQNVTSQNAGKEKLDLTDITHGPK